MESISARIQMCVQASGLTKTAFAQRINVGQSFVSQLCTGRSKPSDRTIIDICREFNINETWLRTGEGDMSKSTPESLAEKLAQDYDLDSLGCQIISAYLRLDENDRLAVGRLIQNLMTERETAEPPAPAIAQQNQLTELVNNPAASMPEPPIPEGSDPEIEAELARIREQRILERRTRMSQASTYGKVG